VADLHPPPPVAAARVAARFSKLLELALAHVNLSLPQYRLLLFLSRAPEQRATVLAGSLDVSPPSLTALVDGCVARGLVERVTSPEDRRRVLHLVTDAGHDVLARADAAVAALLADVVAHVPPAKAKRITDGLELLGEAMELATAARRAAHESAMPATKARA
jgi:long-chain acyl-CoA synthetase